MFEMEGFLSVISLCIVISLGYEYSGTSNVSQDTAYTNTSLKLKTILLWDSLFYLPHYSDREGGQTPFQKEGCSVNNCFITDRLAQGKDTPVDEYDAVLFNMLYLQWFPLPNHRKPHQRYVFLLLESPLSYKVNTDFKDFFNWTMTYRRDSDIWWPYGLLTSRLPSSKDDPRSVNFHLVQSQFDTNKSSMFDLSEKQYLVAWLVSTCITVSGGEIYANELSNYIPIHVYGPCGNYSCSDYNRTACYQLLERNYKFYLSFENAVCKDYVTEKLFDIIKYNVVPIVYGGANYSEIMPPKSYINVADFSSPRELANYLLYLDKAPEEYVKYFWWKSYYRFQDLNVMCKLCEMLHNSNLPHKVYPDIKEWWEGGSICKVEKKENKNVGLGPLESDDDGRLFEDEMFLNSQSVHSSTACVTIFSLLLVFSL